MCTRARACTYNVYIPGRLSLHGLESRLFHMQSYWWEWFPGIETWILEKFEPTKISRYIYGTIIIGYNITQCTHGILAVFTIHTVFDVCPQNYTITSTRQLSYAVCKVNATADRVEVHICPASSTTCYSLNTDTCMYIPEINTWIEVFDMRTIYIYIRDVSNVNNNTQINCIAQMFGSENGDVTSSVMNVSYHVVLFSLQLTEQGMLVHYNYSNTISFSACACWETQPKTKHWISRELKANRLIQAFGDAIDSPNNTLALTNPSDH